ncbi:hypothetical protein K4K59_008376 [Colletotrichum sp. SAR11_240]|nr:hypothetical protein K4K59_008376 [Colletotrichum sp. SAR11_240]
MAEPERKRRRLDFATQGDLLALRDDNWLHGDFVNIPLQELCGIQDPKVFVMTSYYTAMLLNKPYRPTAWIVEGVATCDRIFMVCNLKRNHWALLVIQRRGFQAASVDLYDSLQSYAGAQEAQSLADAFINAYLPQTPSSKRKLILTTAPQQQNGSDCGVFTVAFGLFVATRNPIPARLDGRVWRRVLATFLGSAATD